MTPRRHRLPLATASLLAMAVAAAGCGSGGVSYVEVVLDVVESPSPFADLASLRVTVTGDGMTPLTRSGRASEGDLSISPIPQGKNRVILVEGLDNKDHVVASGRSSPFELTADDPSVVHVRFARTERFALTGRLQVARGGHTATLLSDGRVVIAGGEGASGVLASVEIYDPSAGKFTSAPSLRTARTGHAAVLLGGRVLIVGGRSASGQLASVEVYEPQAGTTAEYPLTTAREAHTVTTLRDGRGLVVGGLTASGGSKARTTEDCELINTQATAAAGKGPNVANHVALALSDGRVLVAGGRKDPPGTILDTVAVYDPGAGSWNLAAARLPVADEGLRGALLADGRAILVGGQTAVILGAGTVQPTSLPALSVAYQDHAVAALGSGALVAGGTSLDALILEGGTFRSTGSLNRRRQMLTLTPLTDGTVLVVGGFDGSTPVAEGEIFFPR